jgi:capsid assembly protease
LDAGQPRTTRKTGSCRPDQLFGFWSIEPVRFGQMLDVVQSLDLAQVRAENAARTAAATNDEEDPESPLYVLRTDGIAMIDVSGPLTKYPPSFQSVLGGTSMLRVREGLRAAVRDPNVLGILLVVDSPGGTVAGTSDLFADVRAADAKKPVYAHIEDLAASGGLYAAMGARRVTSNANAEIGSVGTFMKVNDTSGAYAARGVKAYVISSASPIKGAGSDGTEISEDQCADWERRVKDLAAVFVRDLGEARHLTQEQAQALHTGQCWVAEKALSLGLIDGVCSLDEAIVRLRSEAMTVKTSTDLAAAMSLAEEAEKRAGEEKALRIAAEAQVATLTARVADLEKRVPPPAPGDPIKALIDAPTTTAETRAALEAVLANASAADQLRSKNRLAEFTAKAAELGAGTKLPIKAEELAGILVRAEDNTLTSADRGELERLMRVASAASVVGRLVGSSGDNPAGGASAYQQAMALAQAKVEGGQAKTLQAALTAVWAEKPALWEQHEQERAA